jgi:hypothetical protein
MAGASLQPQEDTIMTESGLPTATTPSSGPPSTDLIFFIVTSTNLLLSFYKYEIQNVRSHDCLCLCNIYILLFE